MVTSCYGMRWGKLHAGVDLALATGTPEHAAGAGTVISAGWAYSGYGISVMIDHGNGIYTHYAHESQTIVHVGQHVSAGQVVGYEGATGDVTGPHLHFEVHVGLWHQIEPTAWMRAHGVIINGC
jgi:murein DD-endopeptidase MepM/ murein hydrolase activator NlpD